MSAILQRISVIILLFFFFLWSSIAVSAAGPAGVEDGLQLWFSADTGVKNAGNTAATDGQTVITWEDQSPLLRNATKQDSTGATFSEVGLNYNPTLNFNGNNYTFSPTGLPAGSSDRSIFVVASTNDIGGWRYVLGAGTFGGGNGFDFGNRSGSGTVFITTHSAQEAQIGSWTPLGTARLAYGSVTGGTLYLSVNGGNLQPGGSGVDTVLDGSANIGANSGGSEQWYGSISEVIMFNRTVTNTERQRINSYLALKYGFSLDQSTPQSYLASGDAIMWDKDAALASTYNNGLFGIGRDDSSTLAQLKSRGQTATNIIILEAVGEGSNGNPSFQDIQDLEFLVIGDNSGSASWTTTGAPTGYSILERQWMKQEQGDVGPVNLDFDVADSDFDVPDALDGEIYYFVYDSDSDGSLADETPQAMIYQGSNIWRTTVDFGVGGLFTIASTENPAIKNLSPPDNATGVGKTSNLTIVFSKEVTASSGAITIKRTDDDSIFETIDVTSDQVSGLGSSAVTINPLNDFAEGFGYYVQIAATAFKDGMDRFFAGISTKTGWNFTVADSTAPVISAIAVSALTNTSATITWSTNENASTKIVYGLTSSYGISPAETDLSPRVTSHSVALSSLLACTTYHYKLTSTDAAVNTAHSEDRTFTTSGCPADTTPTKSTTNEVSGTEGGSTSLTENSTQITVQAPEHFATDSASVVIQIKAINSTPVLGQLGKPPTLPNAVGSIVFDVKAIINDTIELDSFDAPVTITYQYSEEDAENMEESSFWLYHYHDGAWVALDDCTLTPATNTISCTTESFSIFGLFGNLKSSTSSAGNSSHVVSDHRSCSAIKPDVIPDLFQIDVSHDKAVVYFTPLMNNVTNYFIAYGYRPGEERFGVYSDLGPSTGVLTYTINHLDKNMDYYFKVRPQNGCASGDWGNIMKITTTKNAGSTMAYFKSFKARVWALFPRSVSELSVGKVSAKVAGASTKRAELSRCEYIVRPGDTLWSIATSELGSSTKYKEIMDINNLSSTVLRTGQQLKIGC